MRSPRIGTVLPWRPLDVHIFSTDPSLVLTNLLTYLSASLLLENTATRNLQAGLSLARLSASPQVSPMSFNSASTLLLTN